jgi:DsbC/DsbD-like thiol-disulfide interchange protein
MRFLALIAAFLMSQGLALADEASHVQARLIANVASVDPGKPFMLGVELTIDPGWHVYWKNPGDAGRPTRVKISAPEGFKVGELLYPVPARLEQPGNIVNFGYENKVLLMAQITPPAFAIKDQPQLAFSADISWLVCQDICIMGKTNLNLALPVDVPSNPDNAEIFESWLKRIPMTVKDASGDLDNMVLAGGDKREIKIIWKHAIPTDIQFFPGVLDDYNIKDVTIARSGDNETSISFTAQAMAGKSPPHAMLDVVVAYKNQGGEARAIEFAYPLAIENRTNDLK